MADKSLFIEIVTPQKVIFSGWGESVTVPGSKSPFQVLFNHAPIVSSLDTGLVKIVSGSNILWYAISTGFIEVHKNKVSILVETAEEAHEINIAVVQNELQHYQNELKATNTPEDKDLLEQKILLAKARLKATEKIK